VGRSGSESGVHTEDEVRSEGLARTEAAKIAETSQAPGDSCLSAPLSHLPSGQGGPQARAQVAMRGLCGCGFVGRAGDHAGASCRDSEDGVSESGCPFCFPPAERLFHIGKLVLGLWDGYPVSRGHALLVPKRHVATWFDATFEEQAELNAAIAIARAMILEKYQPDGFNIGVNVGEAAGQTVFHLHVHVIPRYRGDVPNPRGGVRHVIPCKAHYPTSCREGRRALLAAHGTVPGQGKLARGAEAEYRRTGGDPVCDLEVPRALCRRPFRAPEPGAA
jgi:diadenosine tetraphosphate (Ap4A) HIT family hydrolase